MNKIDLTVAIPTFNGAKRLPQILGKLREQVNAENISWEVIVVDNNSSDRTAEVIQEYQAIWSATNPLHYCFAPHQGAAFARQRAIEKARGNLVGFIDDDILPGHNWIASAYTFAQNHPQAGAIGSQIHGEFEVEPPPDINKIKSFLAIIERGNKPYIYEPSKRVLPPSAGLVVRRQAWLENVPKRIFLHGPTRNSILASEDIEVLVYIQQGGWDIWYNPEMDLYHQIPNHRLKRDYLISLVRGIGLARHHIRTLRTPVWLRPIMILVYLANDLQRWLLHIFKYGNVVKTDLAAACELEWIVSSIKSPFYLWYQQILVLPSKQQDLADEACLEEIAQAFEEKRFRLYSQLISPLTEQVEPRQYQEILLRIENADGKLILPEQFLPVTERYNLSVTIDRWVIRTLFAQLAQAVGSQDIYQINLARASIEDDNFIDFLQETRQNYPVHPGNISFSITEKFAIANLDQVIQFIHRIKNLGYKITLDQSDSQISNTNYSNKLPVNYLKLDHDSQSYSIVYISP